MDTLYIALALFIGLLVKERFTSPGKWVDFWLGMLGIWFTAIVSILYLGAIREGALPLKLEASTWVLALICWVATLAGSLIRRWLTKRYRALR